MTLRARVPAMLLLALLAAGDCAYACSCLQRTEAEHLESSAAVFEAEVVEVRSVRFKGREPELAGRALRGQRARVRVTKSLKGPHAVSSFVTLQTVTECCMCGVEVRRGERWLIFVDGKEPYDLSLCSGSHRIDVAQKRETAHTK